MVNKFLKQAIAILALAAAAALCAQPALADTHGISMHGQPKYGPEFAGVDFVNPKAPKGGRLRLSVIGSFDSLNPFIIKGAPAFGPLVQYNRYVKNLVYETLLKRSVDEPFALYGLLAQTVEMAPDRSWIRFTLNPDARFHGGAPVTVDDVLFSWKTLKEQGRPNHRLYYGMVAKAEKTGERQVTFTFKPGGNAELPLLIGLMPILPKAYFKDHDFAQSSLTPIPGSGPYYVSAVDPGRKVTFTRDPDYWGKDLPVNRGLYNFDTVTIDYYRDSTSEFEAFKSGLTGVRVESDPNRWDELKQMVSRGDGGAMTLADIPNGWPAPMRGLVFNTRRPLFADIRVRKALSLAMDFEWMNTNFFHGLYTRTKSFLDGSFLAAKGPAEGEEKALLEAAGVTDPAVYAPPPVPASAPDATALRRNLRKAAALLTEAGWRVQGGQLVNAAGEPFRFDILIGDPQDERLALHFARNLERLGITAKVRTADSASYQGRLDDFDFDMIVNRWDLSLSPGNELSFYFGSAAADTPGTRNYMGMKSKAVDALIHDIVTGTDQSTFDAAVRALDRVMLAGHYLIPLYHAQAEWLAYRPTVARPEKTPLEGYILEGWWATR